MFGDIAILVFALIGIFAKKRWAVITATIWFIVAFLLGFTLAFTVLNFSPVPEDVPFETFENSFLFLGAVEVVLIIIGWIRVRKSGSKY